MQEQWWTWHTIVGLQGEDAPKRFFMRNPVLYRGRAKCKKMWSRILWWRTPPTNTVLKAEDHWVCLVDIRLIYFLCTGYSTDLPHIRTGVRTKRGTYVFRGESTDVGIDPVPKADVVRGVIRRICIDWISQRCCRSLGLLPVMNNGLGSILILEAWWRRWVSTSCLDE